ncbi:MAG: GspH/FimT family pseudopilin [Gammaproteobacteria bacterium]
MNIHRGFTLVELMITLALAAILLSIGIPSFQSYMEINRLAAQTNQMVQSLNLARSEAGKRGGNVVVAPLVAGNWAQGWQVWVDPNGNNSVDAGEEILLTVAALTGSSSLTSTVANYRYLASGRIAAIGTLTLTASTGGIRDIAISNTGRISITKS